MPNRNLALELLITAKDTASTVIAKAFRFLDRTTSATANLIREKFTDLFGGGVRGAADFEAQLDRVAAKGGYAADQMRQVSGQVRSIAAQFGISSTEAAKGMESLAAAGLSAKDAIGALPQVLALAASEQISADAAAQKLVDSLSIMGLGFEQAGRMADVLAKGANITTSTAAQLAESLSEAGGTARAAGMDLEYTVAALDLLHKNGIKGSEAGTALKGILVQLLDPTSQASKELDKLGISSRDLGTVLQALKDKGGEANGAILAFGQEAGPGLRALINEGQAALDGYTLQLKNAEGAAADAAEQMGGNLKTAWASMTSAWESLKAASIDPLLEPIAKQVTSLSKAFQGAVEGGAIQKLQGLVKEFGTGIAAHIESAIQSFDFKAAADKVTEFAEGASGQFGKVEGAAKATAGSVQVAFNAITASVRGNLSLIIGGIGYLFEALSTIEQQAAKVGLGTLERANELAAKAQAAKETAAAVLADAAQDIDDLSAGADKAAAGISQIGQAAEQTKAKVDAIEPPKLGDAVESESIKKTLADYANALDRAKIAQKAASEAAKDAEANYLLLGDAVDKGHDKQRAFEIATQKNADAQNALKEANANLAATQTEYTAEMQRSLREIDNESVAVTKNITSKQELFAKNQERLRQEREVIQVSIQAAQAAVTEADAARRLAQAKGDQQAIAEANVKVAQAELAALIAQHAEQEKELEYYRNIAARIADLISRKEVLNDKEQAELAALQQKYPAINQTVAAREKDIAATNLQIQAQEREINQAERMAGPIGQLIRFYEQKTAASGRETDAIERGYDAKIRDLQVEQDQARAKGDTAKVAELAIKIKEEEAKKAQALADAKKIELQAEIDLIEAKKQAIPIDEQITDQGQEKIAAMDAQIAKLRDLIDAEQDKADSAKAMAEAEKKSADVFDNATKNAYKFSEAQTDVDKRNNEVGKSTKMVMDSTEKLSIAMAKFRGETALAFAGPGMSRYNDLINDIKSTIDQANRSAQALAEQGLRAGAEQAETLIAELEASNSYLNEMAYGSAQNLRQALADARQEAEDMTQSLAEAAESFEREILRIKGNQRELLDREYQDELKRLDEMHQKAGQQGEAEYQQAKDRAEELHKLKMQQLANEEAAKRKQESGGTYSPSAPTGGGSGAPSGGGGTTQHITNNFYTDPTQLASEDWYRRTVIPMQDKFNRLRK